MKKKQTPHKRGELIRWYFAILKHKAPRPTDALPGSQEKVTVFVRRVERGERLFHEDDCKDWEDQRYKGRLFG